MELSFVDPNKLLLEDPPMKNISGDINLIANYIYKQVFKTIKIAFPNTEIDDDMIYLNPYMRMIYFIRYSKLLIKKIGINRLYELKYVKQSKITINEKMRTYYDNFTHHLRYIAKFNGNIKIEPVVYDERVMSSEVYDNILLFELIKFSKITIKKRKNDVPLNMDNDSPYFNNYLKHIKGMTDDLAKFQMMISKEEKYLLLEFIKYELWLNYQINTNWIESKPKPDPEMLKSPLTKKKEKAKNKKQPVKVRHEDMTIKFLSNSDINSTEIIMTNKPKQTQTKFKLLEQLNDDGTDKADEVEPVEPVETTDKVDKVEMYILDKSNINTIKSKLIQCEHINIFQFIDSENIFEDVLTFQCNRYLVAPEITRPREITIDDLLNWVKQKYLIVLNINPMSIKGLSFVAKVDYFDYISKFDIYDDTVKKLCYV